MLNNDFPDAFGNALMDCFLGKAKFYHIERDDNYLEASEIGQYFTEYGDWIAIEREAMKMVVGEDILDIGCGAGRYSIYLQNCGLSPIGVDISPLALKVCKLRGLKQTLNVPITELGNSFTDSWVDSIIMMGNNFGLLGGFEQARKILKDFHRITSPYAKIIATTSNPYTTTRPVHLEYQKWNISRGRMAGQLKFRIRYQNLINAWMDYLFVSEDELKNIVLTTGWQIEKVIPSQEKEGRLYISVLSKI